MRTWQQRRSVAAAGHGLLAALQAYAFRSLHLPSPIKGMGATKNKRPAGSAGAQKEGAAPAVAEEKQGRAAKRQVHCKCCWPPWCSRALARPVAFACAAAAALPTAASRHQSCPCSPVNAAACPHPTTPHRRQRLDAERRRLPAWSAREKLVELVKENQVLVVIGETGSGKTTQVGAEMGQHQQQEGRKQQCGAADARLLLSMQ